MYSMENILGDFLSSMAEIEFVFIFWILTITFQQSSIVYLLCVCLNAKHFLQCLS